MSDWELAQDSSSEWELYNKDPKPPVKKNVKFLDINGRKGVPGLLQDVAGGIYEPISNIEEITKNIFRGAGQAAAQARTNPERFGQNVLGSLGEYGAQIGNIPEAFAQYSKSRGLIKDETDQALYDTLTNLVPRKPAPFDPNENAFQRAVRSIHLPRPGEFNYAEFFGKKPAQFQEEEQADEFIKQALPITYSGVGKKITPLMLQQLGAEENPFTPLSIPATKKAIGVAKSAPGAIKDSAKKTVGFKDASKIRENAAVEAKKLADKIAYEDLEGAKTAGSEMYNSLNRETTAKGITKAEIKKQLAPDFFELASKNEKAYVRKAFRTQSLEDIHQARKDLGKYISDKQSKYKDLTGKEKDALSQAIKIRNNMDSALKSSYRKAGGDAFVKRFDDANKHWKENVIDNEGNQLLKLLRANKRTPEDFIKRAAKNQTFRAQFGKKYPEIIEYGEALLAAEKLPKPKPMTKAAQDLQKDVDRNQLLTDKTKKAANFITKAAGAGRIIDWLTN